MSPEEAFFLISALADAHSPLRGDSNVQHRIYFQAFMKRRSFNEMRVDSTQSVTADSLCEAELRFGCFISCKNRSHIHRSST